jgi:uncharacterized iron-regulated protein
LSFNAGKLINKGIADSENGVQQRFNSDVIAVDLNAPFITINNIADRVLDKKMIYVSETHDRYEHHLAQLNIIKALYQRGVKLAIGMEMFQQANQKALDDYISGAIDEKTFLKHSHYFTTWRFNYYLYRGILSFARQNQIPVIALNIDNDLVKAVSKNGVFSLADEQKKQLSPQMDLTDSDYMESVKEVFQMHDSKEKKDFLYFYEAQLLWDESMAYRAHEFLEKNPNHTMVVIAGTGHIIHDNGIPKRAFRLNGKPYATIVNSGEQETIEKTMADYVIFSQPIEAPNAPKLMIMIHEDEKAGKVVITDFAAHSVAQKAGLKEGDVIVSLDNEKIQSLEDLQVFLFSKRKGDTVEVKALRGGLLLGEKEMTFKVVL